MSFPCRILRSAKQRRSVPFAGLGLGLPKVPAKLGPSGHGSGLALSVIASRCHLSQSERPWQSAKFAVQHFTPCCRKGSRQALRGDVPPLPRAPTLGELDAVRRPERARTLTKSCALGLALPCGSMAPSEARSKPRLCAASADLALSVIASRCHLSQSERFWMYRKVCLLEKALPLGELARSA